MAKNFLRQLKPIDENKTSHVQRIQSSYKGLSEAYDIIPTSELEIDELDIPHNKENLKALFVDITKSTGVGDPIAFSKNPKEKINALVFSSVDKFIKKNNYKNCDYLLLEWWLKKYKLVNENSHEWRHDFIIKGLGKIDVKWIKSIWFNVKENKTRLRLKKSIELKELDYFLFYNKLYCYNCKYL